LNELELALIPKVLLKNLHIVLVWRVILANLSWTKAKIGFNVFNGKIVLILILTDKLC